MSVWAVRKISLLGFPLPTMWATLGIINRWALGMCRYFAY